MRSESGFRKPSAGKWRRLPPEQSARLRGAVMHLHIYWPVLIALSTGARRGEALALRWRHVDLDHGTL